MKRITSKADAKQVVLPHSQAKLDLYKSYLQHYLRVLTRTQFCTRINLYDIFCGIGQYEDGNIGSPLITNNCVRECFEDLSENNLPHKPVTITINDKEAYKLNKVRDLLLSQKVDGCDYRFATYNAAQMIDIVANEINRSKKEERNLVFIDPYGYSDIIKDKLFNILKSETTEVILFLPVSQMYRFSGVALNDEQRNCYANLLKFIKTFFPANHAVNTIGISNNVDFIHAIKDALTFNGQFFTCSHYIERDKGQYYGLFFITSNIYGLEKMVEAKWEVNKINGKGFKQELKPSLFTAQFEEDDQKQHLDFLKNSILEFAKANEWITNVDLYKLGLINEFKPSHVNGTVRDLLNKGVLVPESLSSRTAFYINYQNYKDKEVKIRLKLNK